MFYQYLWKEVILWQHPQGERKKATENPTNLVSMKKRQRFASLFLEIERPKED
jgi:hypothetical protein